MRIPSGKTDQLIYFVAVDVTDLKTRETGLTSFTVYRSRNGGAATAYTTPTVAELSAVNMPGVYSLTIDEDTTIAAGSDSEEYCVHITQAAMAPVTRTIELYRRDTTTGRTLSVDASSRALADVDTIKTNPVVNAGTITFPTTATLASTTNITAGTLTTVTTATNVTTVNGLAANVITATAINTGAITSAKFAAGAIDAAAIATGAIDADAVAADAATEIANAVWDTDCTGRQTQGTFGQAIGDPVADTNTIYKAVVTDATGATVGVDVVAMKVDTAAILDDTGTAGVVVAAGSKSGYSLTATTGLGNQTADITGSLSGSVGSVTGAVGSVTGAVGSVTGAVGSVTGAVGSVTGLTASDVGAIKAKTDSLTFTVIGQVDANIQSVNDVTVTGNGQPGTEWGP
jgi:hypothetical protein